MYANQFTSRRLFLGAMTASTAALYTPGVFAEELTRTPAQTEGPFYPDKLPHSGELGFAARQFGAIEINATFYGRQSQKSWEKWAEATPPGPLTCP